VRKFIDNLKQIKKPSISSVFVLVFVAFLRARIQLRFAIDKKALSSYYG